VRGTAFLATTRRGNPGALHGRLVSILPTCVRVGWVRAGQFVCAGVHLATRSWTSTVRLSRDETGRLCRDRKGLGLTWSVDGRRFDLDRNTRRRIYKLNPVTGAVLKQFDGPGFSRGG